MMLARRKDNAILPPAQAEVTKSTTSYTFKHSSWLSPILVQCSLVNTEIIIINLSNNTSEKPIIEPCCKKVEKKSIHLNIVIFNVAI